jgi:Mg-chelatase subunit ChlD
VYLPLLLKEHCDRKLVRADIALVIDTSSSMTGKKIADAMAAAISFVWLMDLAAGHDQVTVVRFDAEAGVVSRLSNDKAAVERAIRSLETRRGTHIDRGLHEALAELQSRRRIEGNTPVMVLLTDGIHTGTPGAELLAAREVRDAPIRLYTIGLGFDVDESTLIEMAGDKSRYFFAPTSSHLTTIYSEVARDIDCPAEEFWGKR